jgi:hypothetical protein
MKKFLILATIACFGFASIGSSAEALSFRRKPKPKLEPIAVIDAGPASSTDLTRTSRAQAIASSRAALKRGKAALKKTRADLEAVTRSEQRNRDQRQRTRNTYEGARLAYEADKTPQNLERVRAAYTQHMSQRSAHESALSMRNATRRRMNQLVGFQMQAVGSIEAATNATRVQPQNGAPRFNRARAFVRPITAYDRVPQPQLIYDAVQPLPANPVPTQIYGPAPRPAAAGSKTRRQQNGYDQPEARMAF